MEHAMIDLDQLEQSARAATPGKWKVSHGKRGSLFGDRQKMTPFTMVTTDFHATGKITNGPEADICELRVGGYATECGPGHFDHQIDAVEMEANALLIAMASPATILELIERLRAAEERLQSLQDAAEERTRDWWDEERDRVSF